MRPGVWDSVSQSEGDNLGSCGPSSLETYRKGYSGKVQHSQVTLCTVPQRSKAAEYQAITVFTARRKLGF